MANTWKPKHPVLCEKCGWAGMRAKVGIACPRCGHWHPQRVARLSDEFAKARAEFNASMAWDGPTEQA